MENAFTSRRMSSRPLDLGGFLQVAGEGTAKRAQIFIN
jgi:hypothetical protein